ncbi:TrmH family RNA methyltransferase [Actinokineospora auranticolor]|uniref:tRNA (Guanosine-2'-O-)-methyltransferase n=1 Tax=Actinokineospora auranticolor TaxID=155976 RepID=A0A2S6GZ41_9PSEU|nr:TrmH family RNA methyltransferase [Actinokineospora auranticolor]PPK70430.1 tRNA (guanosine-2'-O-)-methyltransferase [Actinokineospora auranticolor]
MKQLGETDLKRLHRTWRRKDHFRLALMLENLQSPFNVGAIARTAAAMGAEALYLAGSAVDVRSAAAQKAAMGSDRFLRTERLETTAEAVARARADGFLVVALELADAAVPLPEVDLARDVCLVLGHEDRGVSAACLLDCDVVAFVPQLGKIGSLNVASAAAVGCYEVRRQGFAAGDAPSTAD